MPRYYFNVHDGVSRPDPDGVELPNRAAAWSEAVRACGEMLRDIDGDLPVGEEWRMDVAEAGGEPVFTLRFFAEEHGRRPNLRGVSE